MPSNLNRALQVRTADRLRASLGRDEVHGLPVIDGLSDADQRALCDVGGGRLAAVAIRVSSSADEPRTLVAREVSRLVAEHVRRTDLFGALGKETLLILSPGLEPLGGQALAQRLRDLLNQRQMHIGGYRLVLRVQVGAAYRSAASPAGWTAQGLAAEAELQAGARVDVVSKS
jgi:hypothetical protein